jgi:hypothetical protein
MAKLVSCFISWSCNSHYVTMFKNLWNSCGISFLWGLIFFCGSCGISFLWVLHFLFFFGFDLWFVTFFQHSKELEVVMLWCLIQILLLLCMMFYFDYKISEYWIAGFLVIFWPMTACVPMSSSDIKKIKMAASGIGIDVSNLLLQDQLTSYIYIHESI